MDNKIVDPSNKIKAESLKRTQTALSIIKKLRKITHKQILENHNSDKDTVYRKTANDIVYNEKSHIVSVFKDYLIYDDSSEFLKR
jgi:ABC-type arginine transport system ATPase subunit